MGYTTKLEAVVKEGRLDVLGVKDGEEMKVEVVNTHCPDWILAEVKGIKKKTKKYKPKPASEIVPNLLELALKSKMSLSNLTTMKRFVITPCCKHQQATEAEVGKIIFCTKCHNPFVEN